MRRENRPIGPVGRDHGQSWSLVSTSLQRDGLPADTEPEDVAGREKVPAKEQTSASKPSRMTSPNGARQRSVRSGKRAGGQLAALRRPFPGNSSPRVHHLRTSRVSLEPLDSLLPFYRYDGCMETPAAEPSAFDYGQLYEYRFRGIDQVRRQSVWDVIARHIYQEMGSPSVVLDPAAGRCEFLSAIPARERWGIDIAEHAELLDSGIKIVIGDALAVQLPQAHFDGVFVSNFLEHLPTQEDVARLLVRLHHAMKPGGRIAVLGPNFRYCAREYFDCADHTLALTHISVAEHLSSAGFTVHEVRPRFLPYSFRSALPASKTLTSAYLKIRPAWRLFGKQFLVVADVPV
jgi:SAM-dependent methyltransferase